MKYKFVVDENIFYCAIRGVDENDNKCNERFEKTIRIKLGNISKTEPVLPEIDFLIQNIIHTSEKIIREFSNSGQFPDEEKIPRKDIFIARCASHFSAKIVTLDNEFREAVNTNAFLKQNGITALHPKEAIIFAFET